MIANKGYTVFFDFDNTITTCDVIDDMLLRFSKDKRWINLEEKWKKGKISSKECLKGQINGLRITREALDGYLLNIKLDPYFKKVINFLNLRNTEVIVLSDNFGYTLKRILVNNGIKGLKIYSNRLEFSRDKLKLSFPFGDRKCRDCAHCKKNNLLSNIKRSSLSIYIGDGLSDICPAQHADIVFAKGDLLRYFKNKKLDCVPYNTLKDVYGYFRRSLIWKKSRN